MTEVPIDRISYHVLLQQLETLFAKTTTAGIL